MLFFCHFIQSFYVLIDIQWMIKQKEAIFLYSVGAVHAIRFAWHHNIREHQEFCLIMSIFKAIQRKCYLRQRRRRKKHHQIYKKSSQKWRWSGEEEKNIHDYITLCIRVYNSPLIDVFLSSHFRFDVRFVLKRYYHIRKMNSFRFITNYTKKKNILMLNG